jgi:hypothetical protein
MDRVIKLMTRLIKRRNRPLYEKAQAMREMIAVIWVMGTEDGGYPVGS